MGDYKFELIQLCEDIIDDELIELLLKWRIENEGWFPGVNNTLSKFTTKEWLDKEYIKSDKRLLFMIKIKGKYYGHVGLKETNSPYVWELDNILRGEEGYKRLMLNSCKALMDWARQEYDATSFILNVALENKKAVRLYERLGFKRSTVTPLIKKNHAFGHNWVVFKPERHNLLMELK